MMTAVWTKRVALAGAVLLFAQESPAAPVKVANPSFGTPSYADGGFASGVEGWRYITGNDGDTGTWNPEPSQTGCGSLDVFMEGIPDGDQVIYSNGADIEQTMAAGITKGHRYTLSVAIGGRCNIGGVRYAIRLKAGNTELASTTGTAPKGGWTEASVTYTSPANDPHAGKKLTITIENLEGVQLNYDNVRLDDLAPGSGNLKTSLLEGITIPGLDNLPFSNLRRESTYSSAEVVLHGRTATVFAFKPGGAGKIHVAVVPDTFDLSDFVPLPSGTPLDRVSFRDVALIFVPPGAGKKGVPVDDFPSAVKAAVAHAGDSVDLKAGINLFGEADFSAPGTVRELLSHVGIEKLNLPLSGGLPADLFSQNPKTAAQNFKNRILDNLDIRLPLPAMSFPGAPSGVRIGESHLHVTAPESGGKRVVDVEIKGSVTVEAGGKTLVMNYDTEYSQAKGINFSAATPAGTQVSLPLFHAFDLSNVAFSFNKWAGRWVWALGGDAALHGHTVNITYVRDPSNPPYVRINTKMTLAQVVGEPGLPALDDVEVDSIQVFKGSVDVRMKIKGVDSTVLLFKQPNMTKPLVTMLTGNFSPADIVPGAAGTPLKDVQFNGLTFVYNPMTAATRIDFATAPPPVVSWLTNVAKVNNPAIQPGMNVFGLMVAHPSGELAKLLKEVGVSEVRLPLNGTIGKSVFRGNPTGAIKNAILESLDITVPLPAISIPGVPSGITFGESHLHVSAPESGGKRGVAVEVKGSVTVEAGGKSLVMDYDTEYSQAKGISINAATPAGTRLTISLIETFSLTDLSFRMVKDKGKWQWSVDAKSTLNNKPVDVTYGLYANREPSLTFHTKMTIADLVGQKNLPGLDDIELDTVMTRPGMWFLHGKVRGQDTYFQIQKNPDGPGHLIAAYLYSMPLTELIPGSSNSPLKDAKFSNVVAYYYPGKVTKQAYESGLRHDAWAWIAQSNKHNPIVRPGLNIFGHIDIHPSGELANLLKKAGVTELKLPLGGGIDKSIFHGNPTGAIKNAILDNLAIGVNIPTPKIPEIEKLLTFHNGKLAVTGKLPDGKRGLHVAVAGDADLHIKGDKVGFHVDVEYDRAGGSSEFIFKGRSTRKWTHPMGIRWLDLDSLTLDIRRKKQASGGSSFEIDVAAKTDVGRHSRLDVDVDVHETDGRVTDAMFRIDGPVDLAEIPEINRVPHADKFELEKLIVTEHGLEADTKIAGRATDLFAFHGSGWNIALTQENFAVTELIPPLRSTPLKEIKFPFLALMLSEDGIDKPFNQLSKVGRDALKKVFTNPGDTVKVDKGLAIIAGFHPDSADALKDGVKGIGVHDGVVIIGEIDGVFGGQPMVKLDGKLSHTGKAHNMPNGTSYAPGEEVSFFINVLESGQDLDFELGIEVGVHTRIKSDVLLFDSKVKMQIMEEGFGIDVLGQMQGTWHKPFGIPGFSLADVTIELGTQEDGAIKLGFGGTSTIAGDKFTMAADGEFLPEALGFP